jgi:hypothetical protein
MTLNKKACAGTQARYNYFHPQPTAKSVFCTRLEDLSIVDVWLALGGGPLRGNRGKAFWRNGDNQSSVLLTASRGTWKDFVSGDGGGIITLVRTARGVDKRGALQWLGENFGLSLGSTRTSEERRRDAIRFEKAESVARELVSRRDRYLGDLRTASRILLSEYHRLLREADFDHDINKVAKAEALFDKLDEITLRCDFLRAATGPDLAAFFTAFDEVAA